MSQALPLEITDLDAVSEQVMAIIGHLDLENSPTAAALASGRAKVILRDSANDELLHFLG